MNKDHIIIGLSMALGLMIVYLVAFNHTETITIVKPEIKTIIEEKIVYIERERDKEEEIAKVEIKKTIIPILPEVEIPLTEDNEFIITQTTDNQGRFTIELISEVKPPKEAFFNRKVIVRSIIHEGEYNGRFLFVVPPLVLENMEQLKIKISDAISGESYSQPAYCIEGLEKEYAYSMEVFYSSGFECIVSETGQEVKFPKTELMVKINTKEDKNKIANQTN